MERPLIVVTGASGRVGQNVVSHLLRRRYPHIRAAFHHVSDATRLPEEVQRVAIEYHDPASVSRALQGAQRLFLLTPGGVEQVEETRILVEAAVECGVEHVVKVGTLECDVQPILPTDAQCAEAEQRIRDSGRSFTFLRCSFFNQLFVAPDSLEQVRAGAPFTALCDGRTAWVDCRDVGEAAANVLMEPAPHVGRVYNLTGPDSITFDDIQQIMSKVAEKPVPFMKLSQEMLAQIYANESDATIEARMGCLVKLREGYIDFVSSDLRELINRAPRNFEQFVRDHAHVLFPEVLDGDVESAFEPTPHHY